MRRLPVHLRQLLVDVLLRESAIGPARTDDNSFAGQLLGQVNFVAGGAFNEVNVGQFIADIYKCRCRGVEKATVGDTRQRKTTGGSEHDAGIWCAGVRHVCCRDGDEGGYFAGALEGKSVRSPSIPPASWLVVIALGTRQAQPAHEVATSCCTLTMEVAFYVTHRF